MQLNTQLLLLDIGISYKKKPNRNLEIYKVAHNQVMTADVRSGSYRIEFISKIKKKM